jgi:hypothetical protein
MKRIPKTYSIEESIVFKIIQDAVTQSMSDNKTISQSSIVNDILKAHYDQSIDVSYPDNMAEPNKVKEIRQSQTKLHSTTTVNQESKPDSEQKPKIGDFASLLDDL